MKLWVRPQDPFSFWSHFLGCVAAAGGTIVLTAQSFGDERRFLPNAVFGCASVLLYAASSVVHHGLGRRDWQDTFDRVDRTLVGFFIAASFTPLCLVALSESWASNLVWPVWGMAGMGAR